LFYIDPGREVVGSQHQLHGYLSQESGIDVAGTGVLDSHHYCENTDENYQVYTSYLLLAAD